jgi:oligoribonuclease NrnB/cAMP/cGMP phosphodiesterase (DHH superfamily)
MRTIAVSHKACHDGLAGAWVARQFDKNIEVFFSSRQHEWRELLTINAGDFVYFIDFTPQPADLEALIGRSVECLILDHHETDLLDMQAFDATNKTNLMQFCKFDMNNAGCMVAWNHFFPGKTPPKMLEYVAVADLWKWRGPEDYAAVQYIRTLLDPDASIDEFDALLQKFNEETAINLGSVVYNRVIKDAKHTAKHFCLMDFDGTEVAAVNASLYQSEVGHELTSKSPSGIGVVYNFVPEKNYVRFSVRGNGSNTLAKKYKGGGHPQAAGFTLSIEQFNKYLATAKKNAIMEA